MSAVLDHEGKPAVIPERRPEPMPVPALASPMQLLTMAVQQGVSIEQLERLMALKREHEADEARNAYNVAFAAFKNEAVKVMRNKTVSDGPLKGKKYAELFSVVNAVVPALSKHGLSHSWKLTKDEKDWLEVTCLLKHERGHTESVSFGGPPDTGGAKSALQARASSVSFLERYTLKAICGVAEEGDDNNGAGNGRMTNDEYVKWEKAIEALTGRTGADALWEKIAEACTAAKDVEANNLLRAKLNEQVKGFRK
jgi:hypothetical protein